jgi:hypothetical protein
MSYTINLTNGSIFATVADGTINTDSSLTIVGKNYAGYGEFLNENMMKLLESGANTTQPASPLIGQLWFDKTGGLLKVYNGTTFKNLGSATAASAAPSSNVTGDLWYDTTNQQLKVYTGAAFLVVGPGYTSAQGQSGAIPETILNNVGATKYITSLYVNNVRGQAANFTLAAYWSKLCFHPFLLKVVACLPQLYCKYWFTPIIAGHVRWTHTGLTHAACAATSTYC